VTRDKTQKRERQGLFNLSHIFEALIESFGHQSEASPTAQADDQAEQQVFESP
jgi:hypothetical protein